MRFDKRLIEFFFLLGATILATYYVPKALQTVAYILLLIAYFRSKNEAMYLVLFLVLSDGFWGFFNSYEACLAVIPGLPPIELGHLYVALALIKASKRKLGGVLLFHQVFLTVLGVYILLLIIQGYLLGLSPEMNIQFRVVKFIFPLSLLYSIPRLFRTEADYREIFYYMFPLAFFALFAQVFTITTGTTPSQYLGVYREFWFTVNVNEGRTYRGFYSTLVVLFTFFGAMYYLAHKGKNFNFMYLFAVLVADFMSVFLSATRGWLLGLGLGFVLFMVFVLKISFKRMARIAGAGVVLIAGLMMIPIINKQLTNAVERFTTLEKLAGGDLTAGGTLERLDKRAPPVMNKWSETPLTGWGFSDTFLKYQDFHVGNQNILLHAGIIGAILLGLFMIFFHVKLFIRSHELHRDHPMKDALLVFILFFPGWFMIHSSSGQHFRFYLDPGRGIVQAVYLSFGAWMYQLSFKPPEQEPEVADSNPEQTPSRPTAEHQITRTI